MIDYILILLAVISFAAQFSFMKVYENSVKQTNVTMLIMLIVSNLAAALLYLCISGFNVRFSWFSFFWAVAMAVVMVPYYVLGVKSLSLGSLAIYSMFMMLGGMLVPFLYGVVFLKEDISIPKIVGCVLLTGFIVLQALAQNETDVSKKSSDGVAEKPQGKKNKYFFFLICILVFLINGATGVIAKAHQIGKNPIDEVSFTIISCLLTSILSGVFFGVTLLKKDRTEKIKQIRSVFLWKPLLVIFAVGIVGYTGNYLLLKAASNVPASVQFPLVSGGVIVISALASFLIFKEKISKKEWISIAGAFLSTFLFAF